MRRLGCEWEKQTRGEGKEKLIFLLEADAWRRGEAAVSRPVAWVPPSSAQSRAPRRDAQTIPERLVCGWCGMDTDGRTDRLAGVLAMGDRAGHAGGWGELRISAQGLQRKWSRPHTHHRLPSHHVLPSTRRTSQDQQTPFCVWEYFKGLDPKFRLKPVVSRKARALSPFPAED